MTKEAEGFFIRLALPINIGAFAYCLYPKDISLTAWLILLVFLYTQAAYHLFRGQKRSTWFNVMILSSVLMSVFAYIFFSGSM